MLLMVAVFPIMSSHADTWYSFKYSQVDKDSNELTNWEIIIPEGSITKLNKNTYTYIYKLIPDNANHYTWYGLNMADISKNVAVECINTSNSNLLDLIYAKCSLSEPKEKLHYVNDVKINKMFKKIIAKQCKLSSESSPLNKSFQSYNCND